MNDENINEDKTADQMEDTIDRTVPETWDELVGEYPALASMPRVKPAYEYSPTETALFTIMYQHVVDGLAELRKLGFFDGKVRAKNNERVLVSMAEIVEYADRFYRSVAEDAEKYDAWMKGRELYDLFLMLVVIVQFHWRELGKSSRSKTASPTVA